MLLIELAGELFLLMAAFFAFIVVAFIVIWPFGMLMVFIDWLEENRVKWFRHYLVPYLPGILAKRLKPR